MKELNLLEMQFMLSPLNEKVFNKIFELKADKMELVSTVYKESLEKLKKILWAEFNIPGMDVRTANTALNWLISRCMENQDLAGTLKGEIKNVILHAAIFYTNVAPNAITDIDWSPESSGKSN